MNDHRIADMERLRSLAETQYSLADYAVGRKDYDAAEEHTARAVAFEKKADAIMDSIKEKAR